ncbi:MAG TPA: phosphoribosyltransferase, partial [Armatimonadetes bacterium]|nr:phosphoribosyltransferase [Armatimonadota bacterium]
MIFTDRADAGIKLADKLKEYKSPNTIVLAIPRGGVVVGFEVARALDAPLDLVIPRKIGAPAEPELAIGAVAGSGEVRVLDSNLVRYLGVSQSYIDEEVERQVKEIERRSRL